MGFDSESCNCRIQHSINLIKKRRFVGDRKSETFKISMRSNFLLVPNRLNSNVNISDSNEVMRIE